MAEAPSSGVRVQVRSVRMAAFVQARVGRALGRLRGRGKLDLRDRVQAVVFAYESSLVEPGATAAVNLTRLRQRQG